MPEIGLPDKVRVAVVVMRLSEWEREASATQLVALPPRAYGGGGCSPAAAIARACRPLVVEKGARSTCGSGRALGAERGSCDGKAAEALGGPASGGSSRAERATSRLAGRLLLAGRATSGLGDGTNSLSFSADHGLSGLSGWSGVGRPTVEALAGTVLIVAAGGAAAGGGSGHGGKFVAAPADLLLLPPLALLPVPALLSRDSGPSPPADAEVAGAAMERDCTDDGAFSEGPSRRTGRLRSGDLVRGATTNNRSTPAKYLVAERRPSVRMSAAASDA